MIHAVTCGLPVDAFPHNGIDYMNKLLGNWFIQFVRSSLDNFSIE